MADINLNDPFVENKNDNLKSPNNWTPAKEGLLIKWRQQARVYNWLHAKSAAYKQWWNARIFYTTVFLSSLGLAQNFSVFASDNSTTFRGLQMANTIVLTVIGVLNIYLKTSKIAELAEKHTQTAKDFYAIQAEIEEHLAQSPEDRDDGKTHLKNVRVKLTMLTKESPEITDKIWNKFAKAVKNGEIFNESDPTSLYIRAEQGGDQHIAVAIEDTNKVKNDNKDDDHKDDLEKKPIQLTKTSSHTSTDSHNSPTFYTSPTFHTKSPNKINSNTLKRLEYEMARFN